MVQSKALRLFTARSEGFVDGGFECGKMRNCREIYLHDTKTLYDNRVVFIKIIISLFLSGQLNIPFRYGGVMTTNLDRSDNSDSLLVQAGAVHQLSHDAAIGDLPGTSS